MLQLLFKCRDIQNKPLVQIGARTDSTLHLYARMEKYASMNHLDQQQVNPNWKEEILQSKKELAFYGYWMINTLLSLALAGMKINAISADGTCDIVMFLVKILDQDNYNFYCHCFKIKYRQSEQQVMVYRASDLKEVNTFPLNVSPTILIPYYDQDSNTLFVTGKVY